MAGSSDVGQMIGEVPFFAGLGEKARKALVRGGKEISFEGGHHIVGEGDAGVGFYLVLEGKAEVRKGDKLLATLGRGQFFGEMTLVDGEPRSADVVAVNPTRCWVLTSWNFTGLVKAHPEIAFPMLKELVRRLRAAQSSPTA